MKSELRDLQSLRTVALEMGRLRADGQKVAKEVSELENDLHSTGSMKTGGEVQEGINKLTDQL